MAGSKTLDWLIAVVAVGGLMTLLLAVSLALSLAMTATLGTATGSIIRLSVLPAVWYLAKPTINAVRRIVCTFLDGQRPSDVKSSPSPQQKFVSEMRSTLLSTAKEILSNDHHPLDRLTAFHGSFCGIIAGVRKIYGPHIVDENSLAMQMVKGFGEGGKAHRVAISNTNRLNF